jgi:hypothetical protein
MNDEQSITQEQVDQFQAATKVRKVFGSYVANFNDNCILADSSGGDIVVTLPLAKNGKEFIVVKGSPSNNVTIQLSGTDKIFGASNISMVDLGTSKRLKSVPGGYISL